MHKATRKPGSDYDPNGAAGSDLTLTARLRVTDTNNCIPSGCNGPYTQAATTTDFDLPAVPVNCVRFGPSTTPPGSDCNITTTVNSLNPSTFASGKLTSVTVFRIRVDDHLGTLFQQQGTLIP